MIHQELAERGHLNQFLDNLGALEDRNGPSAALLLQPQSSEIHTDQATDLETGRDESLLGFTDDSIVSQHVHKPQAESATATATGSNANASITANTETLAVELSQQFIANIIDGDAPARNTASHAPSVLDAAVAAYKQEKRRLWKVCFKNYL